MEKEHVMPIKGFDTLPLKVSNTGFLLDRLGEDCHPLQFLRELSQNAIEAIGRTPEGSGEIALDVDWTALDVGDYPSRKLCIIDTGDGMTGEEMVKYINQLSSSMAEQSMTGNYGVGAKIAAATRNHAGLIYLSWKDGRGTMIHLWRDPETAQYGLRQFAKPDGTHGHFAEVDDAVKPEMIKDHGTKIVLLGNSLDIDTMQALPETPSPSRWIAKYLNTRYFELPEGVTMKAREGWEHPRSDGDRNLLRRITGQAEYLRQHAQASGEVPLSSAKARWWILKDEPALQNNSGFVESSGHIGALFKGELYEVMTARAGRARLQHFGVVFGHTRVVVYVEPTPPSGKRLTTNTARMNLLIDGQPLPWTEWEAEFRDNMPKEIVELMEEVSANTSTGDNSKQIRDRLKALLDLFHVSRYRPTPTGSLSIDDLRTTRGGQSRQLGSETGGGPGRSGGKGGTAGGIYSVFQKKDGVPGQAVKPDPFPKVRWVSIKNGTREPGDIEDRAARFLADQNLLLINEDFRVFGDLIDKFVSDFGQPGVKPTVTAAVQCWFEQALTETVIGVQALNGSKEWNADQIGQALSEEGLTAAAMARYHVYNSVKRELGSKLGKLSAV
jgi:hypothetical protein